MLAGGWRPQENLASNSYQIKTTRTAYGGALKLFFPRTGNTQWNVVGEKKNTTSFENIFNFISVFLFPPLEVVANGYPQLNSVLMLD